MAEWAGRKCTRLLICQYDQQLGNIDRYVLSIEGTIEFYLYAQKKPICRMKKRISNLLMIGCENFLVQLIS